MNENQVGTRTLGGRFMAVRRDFATVGLNLSR